MMSNRKEKNVKLIITNLAQILNATSSLEVGSFLLFTCCMTISS